MRRQGHSVRVLPVSDGDLAGALAEFDPGEVLVFNWCEDLPGVERSEVLVAETLEKLQFTYTGASPRALKLSYDKPRVKRLLEARGIPTPRWKLLRTPDAGGWDDFPAIVKPAWEHCSIGVDAGAVVSDRAELEQRAAYVLDEHRQPALVEDFVDGREFHVPLWGNEDVEVLPAVEMDFSAFADMHQRLCSYDAKFVPDSEAYRKIKSYVPARLTTDELAELESVSKAAYEALGCRDYGRIDARLRDGVFYVLDVNPNADISADASIALAAGKVGYCYGALGSRVVRMAAERHAQNLAPHQ
jgi:D-alanine-D-alanine ligase